MISYTEEDLKRVERVTANYFFWQGLRWVPVGFVILIASLKSARWWPFPGIWREITFFAAVAATIPVSFLIGRYYERVFGRVKGYAGLHRRRELLKWYVVYPAMFGSLVIDISLQPSFFISGPVWAAGITAYWWSTGHGRQHYLLAALSMLALSIIQWQELIEPGKPMFVAFGVLLGAIYMLCGLLDHFELRRILRPIREVPDDATV